MHYDTAMMIIKTLAILVNQLMLFIRLNSTLTVTVLTGGVVKESP